MPTLLSRLLLVLLPLQAFGFSATPPSTKAAALPENVKLLILPGFGNDAADYTIEGSLVQTLSEKGWAEDQVKVLPVERSDWLKVFLRGALDIPAFWKSNAPPTNPAFRWYLDLVAEQVRDLKEDESMVILGHSAGGWLARAALGYGSTDQLTPDEKSAEGFELQYKDKVLGLVTLGAPHLPPPEGFMDMTQGALRLTNENFPGAYHADDLFYITVLGLCIQGEKQERKSPFEPTSVKGFAFNSYEAVCGQGDVIGDGVVPLVAGHLDGAKQINLKNVPHSINNLDSWYGATGVIDSWHEPMLNMIKDRRRSSSNSGFNIMQMFEGLG